MAERKRRPPIPLTVRRTESLTPHLRRVWLGGRGFAEFVPNEFTDSYVKLVFPPADESVPEPKPRTRTYTVRHHDPDARELAIDFVIHGDEGIAGPWAARAEPGDELMVRGPGGAYAPRPDVDWHLLVADESSLPATAAALEALPEGARAVARIEVSDASEELAIETRAEVDLEWVHRGEAAPDARLIDAVHALTWRAGRVQAFVHGEKRAMKTLRRHLLDERNVSPEALSISGYWRRGKDEDGFQAEKADDARRGESG